MPRKESILKVKSESFAHRITNLHKFLLEEKHEKMMSLQIYRSGTSIGANIAESINAESRDDFIHKLSIALKEANETEYWLKALYHGGYIDQYGFDSMQKDNEELIKILVKSIKTLRENNNTNHDK